MDEDFYNILGIEKTANKVEIKKAYNKLVLQFSRCIKDSWFEVNSQIIC
jgi:preprotein translocase subunit Sec63